MTHEELSEMYELYSLGVLDASEKDEIDEHLDRGCPECRDGVRRALEFNAMFATLPEQVTPPKGLRKRVLASVGSHASARPWPALWAGWATAACLLIALVVAGLKLTEDVNESHREVRASNAQRDEARRALAASQAQVESVRAALDFLNQPDTVQATFGGRDVLPPRGRVFVNPSRGVLLIASHLPPAPSGKTYEMWLVPKKGAPLPAGLFDSDAQGNALHMIAGPVDRSQTAAIAVSVEPRSGSPAPTTKPLIVAPLAG